MEQVLVSPTNAPSPRKLASLDMKTTIPYNTRMVRNSLSLLTVLLVVEEGNGVGERMK